ncbi:MAG: hypothetical protein GY832_30915 [Chloroflexi bacterium]|nr:hypothetical protein [Chloroflexota bacterium]
MSAEDTIVGKVKATQLIAKWSGGVIGKFSAEKLLLEALENHEIPCGITGELKHRWYMSEANLRRWYDSKFSAKETR